MVSVTSAAGYITSASCYHTRYQSRPLIYIRGLIPRNSSEFAEAVPIGVEGKLRNLSHVNILYIPFDCHRKIAFKCSA